MIESIEEFLNAGVSRQQQLEADVRELYRFFGFDLQTDPPEYVYSQLTTCPVIASRVTGWYHSMKPEHRSSRTLSEVVRRRRSDAELFKQRMRWVSVIAIDRPSMWFESVAHFDRLGRYSVAELEYLKNHWLNLRGIRVVEQEDTLRREKV